VYNAHSNTHTHTHTHIERIKAQIKERFDIEGRRR